MAGTRNPHWFKARSPEQGVGYGIASPAGLAATVAFIAIFTAAVIGTIVFSRGNLWLIALGVAVAVSLLTGFLLLVRAKSDWKG